MQEPARGTGGVRDEESLRAAGSEAHGEAGDAWSRTASWCVWTVRGRACTALARLHRTASASSLFGPLFPQHGQPSHPRHRACPAEGVTCPHRGPVARALSLVARAHRPRLASRNGWLPTAEGSPSSELTGWPTSACLSSPDRTTPTLGHVNPPCNPNTFLTSTSRPVRAPSPHILLSHPPLPHAHPSRYRFMSPACRARLVELHL
jgi:hypothetical protein